MHRKPESYMFPLDTELERTLRNLRKVRRVETTMMAKERMGQTVKQETATERPLMQDTMEDFWRPVIQKNPRDRMVVQLRSGKELSNIRT